MLSCVFVAYLSVVMNVVHAMQCLIVELSFVQMNVFYCVSCFIIMLCLTMLKVIVLTVVYAVFCVSYCYAK